MLRLSSLLIAATLAAAVSAQTLVVPSAAAAADGNSSTGYPFDATNGRFLSIYDASHFTANGVNFPILISQIRYRANAATTTWNGATMQLQMDLSTSPLDYTAISTTWDSNHGPDRATVFNGPFTIAPGSSTAGTPGPFYATVTFNTPFLYNPLHGDLTIDTTVLGNTTANTPTLDAVTTTGTALARRVYSIANPPAATASLTTGELANVLEFTYVPASGLFPDFSSDVQNGVSPMTVHFTDRTYTSDPNGILLWSWDFDGDGVADSNQQNPTFVYGSCGTYSVSLTVADVTHGVQSKTRVGYIVVDAISASFTASSSGGFVPTAVQFTDTSSGPVLAWMWDFDGDNNPDSYQRNPSFVYALPGTYSVSLTVVNACNQSTMTKTNLITVLAPGAVPAAPEILEYQFDEVRGQEVANTAATAVAPERGVLNVASWQSDAGRSQFRGNEPGFGCLGYRLSGSGFVDTNWPINVSGSFSVSFWLRKNAAASATPFGYAFGNTTFRSFVGGAAASGITFRGSSIGNVDSGFTVDGTPGVWQHLTLVVDDTAGTALWYDNGAASATIVNFAPNTFAYSGAELAVGAISTSGGSTSTIGIGYDLDDFRFYGRALSPVEVLVIAQTGENASAGSTGSHCDGTLGTPIIRGNSAPTQGNAGFTVDLDNAENGRLAAIVFGLGPSAAGTFDLSPWLGAGCQLQTDYVAANFHFTAANHASQSFAIPAGTAFQGVHVYGQWIIDGTLGAVTRMLDINLE